MDLTNRLGAQPGTFVLEVVSAYRRNGSLAQPHLLDGLCDATRLVFVVAFRLGRLDLAEVTTAGAVVAADEESGLAILPTLENIGAASLLTHGVQISVDHSATHVAVLRTHCGPSLDPVGFVLDGRLRILDLDSEELSTVCFDTHAGQFNCVCRSYEVSGNG